MIFKALVETLGPKAVVMVMTVLVMVAVVALLLLPVLKLLKVGDGGPGPISLSCSRRSANFVLYADF